jgi:hypothetical protein
MALSKILPAAFSTGAVLQVKYTQFTSTNVVALSALTDTPLTDLTVSIIPTATNSKILLQAHVFGEHSVSTDNQWDHMFFFYRDTTKLGAPSAGNRKTGVSMATITLHNENNSTPEVARFDYFDEPNTTSAITYKVGMIAASAENWALNRSNYDTDVATSYERGTSFISATEIAG